MILRDEAQKYADKEMIGLDVDDSRNIVIGEDFLRTMLTVAYYEGYIEMNNKGLKEVTDEEG